MCVYSRVYVYDCVCVSEEREVQQLSSSNQLGPAPSSAFAFGMSSGHKRHRTLAFVASAFIHSPYSSGLRDQLLANQLPGRFHPLSEWNQQKEGAWVHQVKLSVKWILSVN